MVTKHTAVAAVQRVGALLLDLICTAQGTGGGETMRETLRNVERPRGMHQRHAIVPSSLQFLVLESMHAHTETRVKPSRIEPVAIPTRTSAVLLQQVEHLLGDLVEAEVQTLLTHRKDLVIRALGLAVHDEPVVEFIEIDRAATILVDSGVELLLLVRGPVLTQLATEEL